MRYLVIVFLIGIWELPQLSAQSDKDSISADTAEHQLGIGAMYNHFNIGSLNALLAQADYPDVSSGSFNLLILRYATSANDWYISLDMLLALMDMEEIHPYLERRKDGMTLHSRLHISHYYSLSIGRTIPLYTDALNLRASLTMSMTTLRLDLIRENSPLDNNGLFSSQRRSTPLGIRTSIDYAFKVRSKHKDRMFISLDIGYNLVDLSARWENRETYLPGANGIGLSNSDGNLRSFYIGISYGTSLRF